MKKFVLAVALCLLPWAAFAQSSPGLVYGQVPTAAQWNSYFAAKQDNLGYVPLNSAGGTMFGPLITAPSASTGTGFNIAPGAAPGSPNNGDLWATSSGLFARIGGSTIQLTGAGSGSFTASNPVAVTFPSAGVVNYGLNFNSSLALDGSNNLGLNLAHANTFTAAQTFSQGATFSNALTFSGYGTSGTCANSLVVTSGGALFLGACPGAASSIQPTVTTITGGTNGRIEYNLSGVLNEASITGPLQLSAGALSINATTTSHGVALWEGTAAMGNTGAGTLGQLLASQGGSTDPAYVSGPRNLLATISGTGVASLSDTTHVTSSYNDYDLVFEGILCPSNNQTIFLFVHSGGAFQTTSYVGTTLQIGSSAVTTNTTTAFQLSQAAGAISTGPGLSGTVTVYEPSGTSAAKNWTGTLTQFNNSVSVAIQLGGFWNNTSAVDGFEVTCGSGNITGAIKLYGRL